MRRWLDQGDNRTKFDRVIFCVFLEKELDCYENLLPGYFPKPGTPFTPLTMKPGEDQEVVLSESDSEEEPANASSSSSSDDEEDMPANAQRVGANAPGVAGNPPVAQLTSVNPAVVMGSMGAVGAMVRQAANAADARAIEEEFNPANIGLLSGAAGNVITGGTEAAAAKAEALGISGEVDDGEAGPDNIVTAPSDNNSGVESDQPPIEERKTSE